MGNCSTAMEAVGSLPVLAAALIRACAALFVRRHGSGQARPRWRPHRARLVLVRCADGTLEIGSSPTVGSEGKAQAGACSPRRPWGGGGAVWCPRRSYAAAAVGRIRAREDGVRRHGAGPWPRCGRAASARRWPAARRGWRRAPGRRAARPGCGLWARPPAARRSGRWPG